MQVQINFGDIESSDALTQHVEQTVGKALTHAHAADQVTRVEVHLRDDKQKRGGPDDKRCMMEARLAGMQPLAVEAKSDDIYKSVSEAAGKLERAVNNKIERRHT